jgi:hypothetical protein
VRRRLPTDARCSHYRSASQRFIARLSPVIVSLGSLAAPLPIARNTLLALSSMPRSCHAFSTRRTTTALVANFEAVQIAFMFFAARPERCNIQAEQVYMLTLFMSQAISDVIPTIEMREPSYVRISILRPTRCSHSEALIQLDLDCRHDLVKVIVSLKRNLSYTRNSMHSLSHFGSFRPPSRPLAGTDNPMATLRDELHRLNSHGHVQAPEWNRPSDIQLSCHPGRTSKFWRFAIHVTSRQARSHSPRTTLNPIWILLMI